MKVSALALSLALLPAAALQAQEGKPEMPTPAAEMKALDVFTGEWACEGMAHPSPMGPGGKMTSTVKSQTDLGGFWQSGTVKSSMAGMPPFEGMFHMTWDPGAKNYVLLWVDNMGAWAQSTAPGWEADKLAFSGDSMMGGQKMGSRDVFVKNADGSLKHTWEVQMDGKWVPMGEETCRKAK